MLDKKEFDRYMTESVETKTEQTIVSYLAGIVCKKVPQEVIEDYKKQLDKAHEDAKQVSYPLML